MSSKSAVLLLLATSSLVVFSLDSATFTVTSNADTNTTGTLRNAINLSNTAGGTNIINFSSGSFPTGTTVTLGSILPTITVPVTINGLVDGSGVPNVLISGNSATQAFLIGSVSGTVAFTNLNISNARSQGPTGGAGFGSGGGGGGSFGAGAAICSASQVGTAITTSNVYFESNTTIGGAGGNSATVISLVGGAGGGGAGGLFGATGGAGTPDSTPNGAGGGGGGGGNLGGITPSATGTPTGAAGGASGSAVAGGTGGVPTASAGGGGGSGGSNTGTSGNGTADSTNMLAKTVIVGGSGGSATGTAATGGGGGGGSGNEITANPNQSVGGNGGNGGAVGGGGGGAGCGNTAGGMGGTGGYGAGGGGGGGGSNANGPPLLPASPGAAGTATLNLGGVGGAGILSGFGGGGGGGAGLGGALCILGNTTPGSFNITDGLFNTNTATGGTGGTSPPAFGNPGAAGSALGQDIFIGFGSTATFNISNALSVNSLQSDSGTPGASITKIGAGVLTLTGTSNYTGGSLVSVGTLQGTTTSLQGTITNNAQVTFNQGSTGTYAGTMTGSGAVTIQGGGVVTFSGTKSYAGSTTVNSSTLTAGSSTGFPNASAFVLSGATSIVNLNGFASTMGSLSGVTGSIVNMGAVNLSVGSDNTSTTFSGVISGSGQLTKQGTGIFTLAGGNNYTGGTVVSAGTLQGTTTSLQGNITDSSIVIFNQSTNGAYGGILSGSGSVSINGTGTVTFSGTNTYMGGTSLLAGTLSISLPANLGNGLSTLTFNGGTLQTTATMALTELVALMGAGTIDVSPSTSLTLSSAINGTGSLTKIDTGTLILSVTNGYTGGTALEGGILQGTTSSLQGTIAITNDASLIFNQSTTGTYTGTISGSGSLTKQGTGQVTLVGTNSYNAGTTVTTGILQGDTNSLQGNITDNASLIFNQNTDGTYTGVISGSGSLTKLGTGQVTLVGTNLYNGGTTVTAGTLQGDTNSLQGNITDNAALIFNQNTTGTYAGIISGSGSLSKQGTGLVTLSGTNAYMGTTTIAAGALSVNGTIIGTATVDLGATLQGIGTVGTVINNGTVSPGNSIGTLTVVGNYTQNSGSTLEIEINSAGASDLLQVSGAVTLNSGSSLLVLPEAGTYAVGTEYTIVTASSVTGTFTNVSFTLPSSRVVLQGVVIYNPTSILLDITGSQSTPFSALVTSANARAVAKCLDEFSTVSGTDSAVVITALDGLVSNLVELNAAVLQLQPSQYTSLALVQESNGLQVQTTVLHRLQELYAFTCSEEWHDQQKINLWVETFGEFSQQKSKNFEPGYHNKGAGVTLGSDYRILENFYAGLATAYTYSDMHWRSSHGKAQINSYYGGIYTTWRPKEYFIDASVFGSYNDYVVHRNIEFSGLNRTAKSAHNGHEITVQLGTGYLYRINIVELQPFARGEYIFVNEQSYKERGAGSLNLSIRSKNSKLWRGELGVNASACITTDPVKVIPTGYLSWVYEGRPEGKRVHASFVGLDCSFGVTGLNPHRNLLAGGIGVSSLFDQDRISLAVLYDFKVGSQFWDNSFGLRAGFGF